MTRYGKSYLIEDTASSNRSKARRYMRNNSEMTDDESMQLDQELRVRFDNANKCDCKFLLGLARMYMNGELEDNNTAQAVNQALGIATEEPYANQINRDLNGMTAMQFIDAFKDKIEASGEADKENLSKQDFGGNNGYDIVLIDSFEKASEYAKYTTWCVTQNDSMYENYTKGGVFYFCLKKGFEIVPKEVGDNAPLDEYGLSMIAVSIYPDGSCNTITCRWNHSNGGNDKVMTTEELSKVIGENFYDVFKPLRTTMMLGGKEYVVGMTKDGDKALYDEQGNNVLGDGVEAYKVEDRSSKFLGGDTLFIRTSKKMFNYITFKNGTIHYLLKKPVNYIEFSSDYSTCFGGPCFLIKKNKKRNYALYQDGKLHYVFDEWFEWCRHDGRLSKILDALCFRLESNNRVNYALYQEGNAKCLFNEWFDGFWSEDSLSRFIGAPCFYVEQDGKQNMLVLRNGKFHFLFEDWFDYYFFEKEITKQVGIPCLKVKTNEKINFITYQDGRIDYMLKEWVDDVFNERDLIDTLGAYCLGVKTAAGVNYIVLYEGTFHYLLDKCFNWCSYDNELSKELGVLCFMVANNGKLNYVMLNDGKSEYLFDEWVDWYKYEHNLSSEYAVPCLLLCNNKNYKYAVIKNKNIEYTSNKWYASFKEARSALKEYFKQNNESRIQRLTSVITEMVIRKIR